MTKFTNHLSIAKEQGWKILSSRPFIEIDLDVP